MSLRGAQRRGNPFSLQYNIAESSTLGEYAAVYEFAQTSAYLPGISAGMRIAAPVCALVRNDMRKTGAWVRVHGRGRRGVQKEKALLRVQGGPAAYRQCPGTVRTRGKLLHVIA